MAAYSSKTEFHAKGLELHSFIAELDCDICHEPLGVPAEEGALKSSTNATALFGNQIRKTAPGSQAQTSKSGERTETAVSATAAPSSVSNSAAITYNTHTAVKIKACGHVFGVSCLQRWLFSHQTCPMCRKVLFPTPSVEETLDDLEIRYPEPDTFFPELATRLRNYYRMLQLPVFQAFLRLTAMMMRETSVGEGDQWEDIGSEVEEDSRDEVESDSGDEGEVSSDKEDADSENENEVDDVAPDETSPERSPA
ncbi:hypothetical protein BU26DRAFT_107289 [Trematosphaeria pertusa]|uniref:RING-type domain-containing protein n=1 Tax=Trematosphaeria pertusa TaxID=390896 RepID=A0A6A6I057_9PLEO|nr:uncharacterized protein BU26DRAFT_107289 [Trematosphaeria pertusa]KAF2243701.1 hypothetical protein BU26DRAFT_107289 [Trematosphaeria pertusa]